MRAPRLAPRSIRTSTWFRNGALALLSSSVLALAAGCTDDGIGRKCINPVDGSVPGQTAIASPALECPSRLCLLHSPVASTDPTRATCTVGCQLDTDCANATIGMSSNGQCASSFVCAIASVTGGDGVKCKKFCVCKDDLKCGFNADAMGNVITPQACPNPSPVPTGC